MIFYRYKKHLAAKDLGSKSDAEKKAILGASFVKLDFSQVAAEEDEPSRGEKKVKKQKTKAS